MNLTIIGVVDGRLHSLAQLFHFSLIHTTNPHHSPLWHDDKVTTIGA